MELVESQPQQKPRRGDLLGKPNNIRTVREEPSTSTAWGGLVFRHVPEPLLDVDSWMQKGICNSENGPHKLPRQGGL